MVTEIPTDIVAATFVKGGVHPKGNKGLTGDLPIERLPLPHRVCLFLKQHVGAPCQLAVKKREDKQPVDALLFGHHPGRIYQQLVTKKTGSWKVIRSAASPVHLAPVFMPASADQFRALRTACIP